MNYKLPVYYKQLNWTEKRKVREQYKFQQGGKCYYCGNPLSKKSTEKVLRMKVTWSFFPPGFQDYPVHLHHSHKTGKTIGAVHMRCNAVLWRHHGE